MTHTAYLQERDKLVYAVSQSLLTYAVAVRKNEKEKYDSACNLLATIAVNVNNDKLTDTQFREFVRIATS